MRVGLLFPDRDLDLAVPAPFGWSDVEHDLGLGSVVETMAQGDSTVQEVVRKVFAQGPSVDEPIIVHRQEAVREVLERPALVDKLYRLAQETLKAKRRESFGLVRHDRPYLYGAIKGMQALLKGLRDLLSLLEAEPLARAPFLGLRDRLRATLSPAFFWEAEEHLRSLRFPRGVWMAAGIDPWGRSNDFTLLPPENRGSVWPFGKKPREYVLSLHPRDETGSRILGELREQGIHEAAKALATAVEEVSRFFEALRAETAFLLGATRLARRLDALGMPRAFPKPTGAARLAFRGLYDVGLALRQGHAVGNDLEAEGRNPIFITGANRGGKTTFLRSLGLAQVLLQAGLFVGAAAFEGSLARGLFTHFKREEDSALEAGKFEEELRRLSGIADHLRGGALLLLNESFAATSEAEGSVLGAQVVRALTEQGVRVVFVTHFYTLAVAFQDSPGTLFLKAERLPDGTRTYRIRVERPEPSAYGEDLLRRVFGER